MPSLLGIDSGLTVTKAVIFDVGGDVLATARRRVTQHIPHPRHVERDMDELWQATAGAIAEAVALSGRPASDILAISATAHGDGIYMLDRSCRPLGHAVVSLDTRAAGIAGAWNEAGFGADALELTGQTPHASAPSALLAWFRKNEPERFESISHFMAAKDWLRFCLTGTIGTDRTEASTSFADVATQAYSQDAFSLYGLDALFDKAPAMENSCEIVGRVTKEAAAASGLAAGTPVVAGLHDVTASALGIGAYGLDVVAVIAGTYSINEVLSHAPKRDARWFCRNGILPGEWNNMSISPASSANYEWFIETLCATDREHGGDDAIHALLGAEFERASARPSSVLFHPYLFGSPHPGVASAGFFGLNAWHDRGDMVRAVIEGIAFNHRIHVDALRSGFGPSMARLTGGISRNPAVAQLFADGLGMPVATSATDEAAAWGAALCAGVGAGVFDSPTSDPRDLASIETVHHPDPERAAMLAEKYALFRDLAAAMVPLWSRLHALGDRTNMTSRPE